MEKKVKYARLSMIVISIIYLCLTILAIISEFSVNTNDSTVGQFSFGASVSIAWWPVLILLLMVISFILYNKKHSIVWYYGICGINNFIITNILYITRSKYFNKQKEINY